MGDQMLKLLIMGIAVTAAVRASAHASNPRVAPEGTAMTCAQAQSQLASGGVAVVWRTALFGGSYPTRFYATRELAERSRDCLSHFSEVHEARLSMGSEWCSLGYECTTGTTNRAQDW